MSSQEVADEIGFVIDISELPFFSNTLKPTLSRVDDQIRKVNEKAYEPIVLSIGPYHYGKPQFKMMEECKLRYTAQLFKRTEMDVDEVVRNLSGLENEIREFYADPLSEQASQELVRMMVVDGCFIIELLYKFEEKKLVDNNDPIFQSDRTICLIQRDLLLLENQLPFFVLQELFYMTNYRGHELGIVDMAFNFFDNKLPHTCSRKKTSEVDHLLGLIHYSWTPSFSGMGMGAKQEADKGQFIGCTTKLERVRIWFRKTVDSLIKHHCWTPSSSGANQEADKGQFIVCTTKLEGMGIRFSKTMHSDSAFEIKFEEGVIRIPHFTVDHDTESLFRNLIAYEQYNQNIYQKYVTDYATFMNCLVDTTKDVEQLCDYGVIENRLGTDEVMSDMFNKLCCNIVVNPTNFYYSQIFKDVNKYRASKIRRVLGQLRQLRYHLRNPMARLNLQISVMALLFAAVQIIIPFCIKS